MTFVSWLTKVANVIAQKKMKFSITTFRKSIEVFLRKITIDLLYFLRRFMTSIYEKKKISAEVRLIHAETNVFIKIFIILRKKTMDTGED